MLVQGQRKIMQKRACRQIITPNNPYKPIVCCTSRAPASEDRGDSEILKKDPYTLLFILMYPQSQLVAPHSCGPSWKSLHH